MRIVGGRRGDGEPVEISVVDGALVDVTVSEGLIDGPVLDASGLTVAPGFIDLQVNGAFGFDFTDDPASIWEAGRALPRTGVTSFCPTIITAPHEHVTEAIQQMAHRPSDYVGAEPIGLHIEGPHLAPSMRGTHPADLLTPPTATLLAPDPSIAILTIAPELDGALAIIERFHRSGTVVAIGHSAATADEARAAIDAGARLGTHLLNAMPPISAREPGIAGVLLTDERVWFDVIVDGHHHDPATVELAWNAAHDRLVLITDAISAAGLGDGTYRIGSVDVEVRDGAARNAEGALAGAATTMDAALGILADTVGLAVTSVLDAATTHPARVLGRDDIGRLTTGARGDVVLLDGAVVVATIVGGRVVHLTEAGRLADPA